MIHWLFLISFTSTTISQEITWSQLSPLPDRDGVAGAFAGVSHGTLLVAGGANFPDKKPWEGGTKVWHDRVYVLEQPEGSWKFAGKLSQPLGYGVSVSHNQGIICVGGSNARGFYSDTFRLEWRLGQLELTALPVLPKPLANACAALVGDTLYIVGGQEHPDATRATNTVYCMDLAAITPMWKVLPPFPGEGRMLATGTAYDHSFWIFGGVKLVEGKAGALERIYLKDGYRYSPANGWKRVADLPFPLAASPAPAPTDAAGIYLLGGDDGQHVGLSPDRHRGFNPTVLRYDASANRWNMIGKMPASQVTVPSVFWKDRWVIPSGEVRPGIRTPAVISFVPKQ